MISCRPLLPIFLGCLSLQATAQGKNFMDSIIAIGAASGGHTGVDLMDIEANQGTTSFGHDHFPMLSVFKFPLALYFLDQADKGKLSLDETLPIRSTRLTIRDLLIAIIQVSDNVACDVLLARAGGPPIVNAYVHSLGIAEINIAVTEAQMAADPKTMYDNWCSPTAMNTLLQLFYQGHILSATNTALLLQWMIGVSTGPHRLKGLLPANTVVAHKTGTSDTSPDGLSTATNDVGIITLPNGHHLIITVFVMDSRADENTREGTIARIARLAYDTCK
jgi:beta-lactamase class A